MVKMVRCASCQSRKGKRQCPALGNLICSVCCGTKREKEIKCTPDCPYLGKAKSAKVDQALHIMRGHEPEHLDVLQNIEFSIYHFYKDTRSITDREVEHALQYLLEAGKGEMGVASDALPELLPNEQDLVKAIQGVFAVRARSVGHEEPQMVKLQCLNRILESVKTHRSPHNTCSYLNFIGQFLP